jgi:hypothetical protein
MTEENGLVCNIQIRVQLNQKPRQNGTELARSLESDEEFKKRLLHLIAEWLPTTLVEEKPGKKAGVPALLIESVSVTTAT